MIFRIQNSRTKLLILGAGASTDYGLPTWKELDSLIRKRIDGALPAFYPNRKEVLSWLDKVGENKTYTTIDECIKYESDSREYRLTGTTIENEVFQIIKDILADAYKENEGGWINKLNEKILRERGNEWENKIAFINFNYDDVLSRNYLDFSYLSDKARRLIHKDSLATLARSTVPALYAHGFLGEHSSPYVVRTVKTMKSGDKNLLDAVSCHESEHHVVGSIYSGAAQDVYILGLGAGLEVSMNNIKFEDRIKQVHVTVRRADKREKVSAFLAQKFRKTPDEIKIYSSCEELLEKGLV